MNLPNYSDKEYLMAIDKLAFHVNIKDIFAVSKRNEGLGITISSDLSKKMYRQSYYRQCIFQGATLVDIGFTGSKFIDTQFIDCNFKNGNFHSCSFDNVKISSNESEPLELYNAGFHKSTFTDSIFENLFIYSCGFTDAIFYNVKFINCTIRLCSLENAQFIDCRFENVNMSTLNIEYADFRNISAESCIFPFHTICSTFSLLNQLNDLYNNSVFSASALDNKISIQEYQALLPEFRSYYTKNEKMFPLANIFISMDKIDLAYEAIMVGIIKAIQLRDFRSIKFLCKLVYLNNIFSVQQRRLLYENINKWISNEKFSLAEYHDYQLSASMIRDWLLNEDSQKPTLIFYLETNIQPQETLKQSEFLTIIDQLLEKCDVSSSSIELRHNSDFVDFLTVVCENMEQISKVLLMIYGSFTGITVFAFGIKKVLETSQAAVLNNDQHKLNKLQQEKLNLEIDKMKKEQLYFEQSQQLNDAKAFIDYEKAKLEYEEALIQSGKYNEILLDKDIKVVVSHSSKNLKDVPFPEMMQYRT